MTNDDGNVYEQAIGLIKRKADRRQRPGRKDNVISRIEYQRAPRDVCDKPRLKTNIQNLDWSIYNEENYAVQTRSKGSTAVTLARSKSLRSVSGVCGAARRKRTHR